MELGEKGPSSIPYAPPLKLIALHTMYPRSHGMGPESCTYPYFSATSPTKKTPNPKHPFRHYNPYILIITDYFSLCAMPYALCLPPLAPPLLLYKVEKVLSIIKKSRYVNRIKGLQWETIWGKSIKNITRLGLTF